MKARLFGFIRALLAIVFLVAGFLKLLDPLAFADGIASFRLLPSALINAVALGLPVMEIVTAGMLLMPRYRRQGSLVALFLSLGFIFSHVWALAWRIRVDCNCFGDLNALKLPPLLGLALAITLMLASLFSYSALVLQSGESKALAPSDEREKAPGRREKTRPPGRSI